jgi:hypothetical protein
MQNNSSHPAIMAIGEWELAIRDWQPAMGDARKCRLFRVGTDCCASAARPGAGQGIAGEKETANRVE